MRAPIVGFSVLLLAALPMSGCSGGGAACDPSSPSLTIVSPVDGASLMTVDTELVVEVCGLERDDQVVVHLLEPVETEYAGFTFFEETTLRTTVPLLPGTMRFEARSGTLRSPIVSVTSDPP